MEYLEQVKQAKVKLEDAESNLVDTYLSQIKKRYGALGYSERRNILSNLEFLASGEVPKSDNPSGFDYETARAIRQESNLTLSALAKQCGVTSEQGFKSAVSRIENGRATPKTTSKYGKVYLDFLKSKGYDPLGI